MDDTDALRVFLLDLLTTMPTDFLATEEGRADLVMSYERMADAAHRSWRMCCARRQDG
ncbi:hypothetical protein [Paracoccus siganidrum]|uniref:hypothetical protein n=1 Tax=Paracoccus siganidrum TaxID=1276757 RepID=UPI001474939A|nr:hypothetical protein [Paracoccus siganidrum]